MKLLAAFLCAAYIAVASCAHCNCSLHREWMNYKEKFMKFYDDPAEDQRRMAIFEETKEYIENHNRKFLDGLVSFSMAVNADADMTDEEFEKTYLAGSPPVADDEDVPTHDAPEKLQVLPESVDWEAKGYVTPVQYQGECSSSWSFSAIGSLEGQYFRKTGELLAFSEQNLLDCSSNDTYGNKGCDGGFINRAFKYIKENGINTDDAYPYESGMKKCRFDSDAVAANITGYVRVKRDSQRALQHAVANIGPISVGLVVTKSFRFYESGVYEDPTCGSGLQNHAALVVGYGREDGKDYWLVKNSWGTYWGIMGYIKMIRNSDISCGIVSDATYPTL